MTAVLAGKIITILYLITLLVIGFWSSQKIKSREDYYVAGRRLSPLLMGIAFFTAVAVYGVILELRVLGTGMEYQSGLVSLPGFQPWHGWLIFLCLRLHRKLQNSRTHPLPDA